MESLPSWNEGRAKQAIMDFVERVSQAGSPDYVAPPERIAVFDNDGTLWSEQPFYFQGLFVFEGVRALADQHPEWKTTQPFQATLERDWKTLAGFGEHGLLELVMATHAGMTASEFVALVNDWLSRARHAKLDRLYTELVYQPMLELLAYLRAHEFKTFIISGGGIEFVRTFSERVYGIPPEQVVGSSIVTKFESRDGVPELVRQPQLNFLDDKEGKPVGINQHIGRRPIAAFGNSDGDIPMLQWTLAGEGARFAMLLHHDDAEREFAYDRHSASGRLERGLQEAESGGWMIVSMKQDWQRVFSFE